jgi:CheY-like chemotaxis protein
MKILIVEDTREVADVLRTFFSREVPTAEIQIIDTESAFIRDFPAIVANPPALAVIDVMLRWDNSGSQRVPTSGEFYEAGFRIVEALASRAGTKSVPVILTSGAGLDYMREQLIGRRANIFFLEKPGTCAGRENSSAVCSPHLPRAMS